MLSSIVTVSIGGLVATEGATTLGGTDSTMDEIRLFSFAFEFGSKRRVLVAATAVDMISVLAGMLWFAFFV